MKKLNQSCVLPVTEAAGAQCIVDAARKQWWITTLAATGDCAVGPINYGDAVRVTETKPEIEVPNVIVIGATPEVIVANTAYRIEVWNPDTDQEGVSQSPQKYTQTSPVVLSGVPQTDRTNVYTPLVAKINAFAGNNVTAYGLTSVVFTTGASVANLAGPIIGEVVTQAGTGVTAQVAGYTLTSGTFATDNAAGTLYLYNLSDPATFSAAAVALTSAGNVPAVGLKTLGTTDCSYLQTINTTYHFQGVVVADDAGYYTSSLKRGGISRASVTGGFTAAGAVIGRAGRYALGSGSDMLARRPILEMNGQNLASGNLDFAFNTPSLPVAGAFYSKIVIEAESGDEDSIDGQRVRSRKVFTVWAEDTTVADPTALAAAAAAAALLI